MEDWEINFQRLVELLRKELVRLFVLAGKDHAPAVDRQ